jgi:hypothetical protein
MSRVDGTRPVGGGRWSPDTPGEVPWGEHAWRVLGAGSARRRRPDLPDPLLEARPPHLSARKLHWVCHRGVQAGAEAYGIMVLDEAGRLARPRLTVSLYDHSRAIHGYTVLLGDTTFRPGRRRRGSGNIRERSHAKVLPQIMTHYLR